MKYTKFGRDKFSNKGNISNGNTQNLSENIKRNFDISEKWLIQKGNNC